jgi:hypothetical protein
MIKEFTHKLADNTEVLFSLYLSKFKEGLYFAKVIDTSLQTEKNKYGILVRDRQRIVFYSSPAALESDLRNKYGKEQLHLEID